MVLAKHNAAISYRSALSKAYSQPGLFLVTLILQLACFNFQRAVSQQPPESTAVAAFDAVDSSSQEQELFFEKDIRPILKVHCFLCHGEEDEKGGGLDLRLVRLMQSGGDSGAAISLSNPTDSLLLQRVMSDEMPPGAKKLSLDEKARINAWLSSGAKLARPEPQDPEQVRFTDEELSHWAFQPIQNSQDIVAASGLTEAQANLVPQVIDHLISERALENGFQPAPTANRAVLLRRLSFNLTGLPPSLEEQSDFLQDQSADAYQKVVDRLLSSPQYGVRWARHWLDIAGYSESEGQIVGDRDRPHAWRYRDYVIDALNRDLPYSQFIKEQIAGDQLISGPIDRNNDEHARLLAATGFLQMAPDLSETENTLLVRNQAVSDTLQIVTSSILGLTVACAQCHDHRYDPISIEDYYRLRAIFDPAFPIQQWKVPSQRLTDLTNDQTRTDRASIEAKAVALHEDINARRRAHCQTIQEREINNASEELRDSLRKAINTPSKDLSEEQKKLLESHPKVRTIDWIVGQLVEYDGAAHRAFQEEEKKVQEIRDSKPLARLVMSTIEQTPDVKSVVFFRGNPESPQAEVTPSELQILRQNRVSESTFEIQNDKRRLSYAELLTDGSHPLVARVIVNRVWQHHFGAGLVRTPGEFGINGVRPTHPELLDFLAFEFMKHGWSLKWLHRQIVSSETFQQSSAAPRDSFQESPGLLGVGRNSWLEDPDNRFLARMSLKRLDAEAVRDAILAVSGQLNLTIGGPSVPIAEDDEGKAVIGSRILRDGLFAGIKDPGEDGRKRSIFLSSKRTLQLNLLQTFDSPEMKPNCQQRTVSTVAPQALLMMNDAWIVQASEKMSERLRSSATISEEQITQAFQLAFCAEPSLVEMTACQSFVSKQADLFRDDPDEKWQQKLKDQPDAAQRRALASLCQLLIASNRFLYVE